MLTKFKIIVIIRYQKKGEIKMIATLIFFLIILIVFIVCVMTITLSDTETFKAIDRKIADKIDKKGKVK